MKLALISAGLFLLSYVVVNGGLGPNPLLIIVPVLVAVGSTVAARWLMRRGRGGGAKAPAFDPESMPMPPPRDPTPSAPPPRTGGKARKLF
jgi:hypothetical protein